jgi:hypothetical protein
MLLQNAELRAGRDNEGQRNALRGKSGCKNSAVPAGLTFITQRFAGTTSETVRTARALARNFKLAHFIGSRETMSGFPSFGVSRRRLAFSPVTLSLKETCFCVAWAFAVTLTERRYRNQNSCKLFSLIARLGTIGIYSVKIWAS